MYLCLLPMLGWLVLCLLLLFDVWLFRLLFCGWVVFPVDLGIGTCCLLLIVALGACGYVLWCVMWLPVVFWCGFGVLV